MEGELRSHFLAGVVIAALMACGTGTAQDATTVEVNATISAPDEAVSMAVYTHRNKKKSRKKKKRKKTTK